MANQTNTLYLRISPRMEEMLSELIERTGMVTNSEIVRQAISEMHQRVTQGGVILKTTRPGADRAFLSGRPRAMTKEEKEHQEQIAVCNALKGTLTPDGTGCVFTMYEKVNPKLVEKHEQELPLSHLTPETLRTQYKPSKTECMKILLASPKEKAVGKKK